MARDYKDGVGGPAAPPRRPCTVPINVRRAPQSPRAPMAAAWGFSSASAADACANCGRSLRSAGLDRGIKGHDGAMYCGLNCAHSSALDASGARYRKGGAAGVTAPAHHVDRSVAGSVEAAAALRRKVNAAIANGMCGGEWEGADGKMYKARAFVDDVDEASNALFVMHINCCSSWRRPHAS